MNRALRAGAVVIFKTAFGPYRLLEVTSDFEYKAVRADGGVPAYPVTYLGQNDDKWEGMLRAAGVARSGLWMK